MSFTWGALGKLFPNSFTNQMWGMVMFDLAAMCWALAFVFKSNSVGQYATAGIGFIIAFLGTLLMVAAEVIMGGQTFVQNDNMGQCLLSMVLYCYAVTIRLIYSIMPPSRTFTKKLTSGSPGEKLQPKPYDRQRVNLDAQKTGASAIHPFRRLSILVKRDLNIPIAVDPAVGFVPANTQPVTVACRSRSRRKKRHWFDRYKNTLTPKQKDAAKKLNEQVIVDVPKLQEQPAPKTEEPPAANNTFSNKRNTDRKPGRQALVIVYCLRCKAAGRQSI